MLAHQLVSMLLESMLESTLAEQLDSKSDQTWASRLESTTAWKLAKTTGSQSRRGMGCWIRCQFRHKRCTWNQHRLMGVGAGFSFILDLLQVYNNSLI